MGQSARPEAIVNAPSTSHENNFRIIRHIAATAVIFSHAFIVNGGLGNLIHEPMEGATGVSLAELAVNIFFITSGFLVTQSILSRRSLIAYFISRGLRIYPALIVVVLLSALVLGPLITIQPVSQYLSTKSVYSYIFFDASAISPYHTRFELPGVFSDAPYPNVVNASLWTLPWEVWMYALLAGLFTARLLQSAGLFIFWLLLMFGHATAAFEIVDFGLYGGVGLRFLSYFFTGALFYRYRDILSLTPARQTILTTGFIVVTLIVQNEVLLPLFLAQTTLFLSLYRPLVMKRLSNGADFSYGIYLYAYPVQQLLVMELGPHDPYVNALLTFVLTVPLAAFSWYFIEKPALSLKPILIARSLVLLSRFASLVPLRNSSR